MEEAEFNQLSQNEQRILIAKDIIQQLNTRFYRAQVDFYTEITTKEPVNYDWDIKSNFNKIDYCHVCALGACALSITKIKNKLIFSDITNVKAFVSSQTLEELLFSIFSPGQLLLIEKAFENIPIRKLYIKKAKKVGVTPQELSECSVFHKKYEDASDRLSAIMQNIVDNDGVFIP